MTHHVLLQFSDVHLLREGRLPGGADPLENLDRAISLLTTSKVRPEAVVMTGDLADGGDAVAYGLLRERAHRLAAATGAEVVFVPGNHDERSAFGRCLLDDTGRSDESGGEEPAPIDRVRWFGGLRLVALDSVIPGADSGELRNEQLHRLRAELASPAPDGTILALHHPPVTSPIKPMAGMALADPARLAAVIDGTDVRLVLSGHNHHASAGMLGAVPVWVSPALSYRSDVLVEDVYVGHLGSAFSRIDVIDGRPLVSVVTVAP